MPDYFFSVVIPALNEEKYLPFLLKDLTQQSFFQDRFEVIVVDGNSEDQTIKKARSFKDKLNLKVFQVKKRNVAYQRNFGAEKARGKWVLFLDADDRLPSYFLDGLKYQIEKHPADIYAPLVSVRGKSKKETTVLKTINFGYIFLNKVGATFALGAMLVVKPKVLNQVQFPLENQVGEDGLFVDLAIKQGFKFVLLKEPTYRYNLRRLYKEGTLKSVLIQTRMLINYLAGDRFVENNFGYVMKGGGYYDTKHHQDLVLIKRIHTYIKNATKEQLNIAKQVLKQLNLKLEKLPLTYEKDKKNQP